jgi:hypothetical protein
MIFPPLWIVGDRGGIWSDRDHVPENRFGYPRFKVLPYGMICMLVALQQTYGFGRSKCSNMVTMIFGVVCPTSSHSVLMKSSALADLRQPAIFRPPG